MQSSALPLGHAAVRDMKLPHADRISQVATALLVLTNGHGEDLIALRVLEELHQISPNLILEVLPLVGEGKVFTNAISQGWLIKRGPSNRLPSGGFSNQSFRGFVSDISAGLISQSWRQWALVRLAAQNGRVILAIGDLLPLFFAWSSRGSFGFIGTPKSDYTWRSGPGSSLSDLYHCWKGTEWDPWEVALMRARRCKLIAVRDQITARGLQRLGLKAKFSGNPMMDGLKHDSYPSILDDYRRILLLCGSRMPEAIRNLKCLLEAALLLPINDRVAILLAIGSEPSVGDVENLLNSLGFKKYFCTALLKEIDAHACWKKGTAYVFIGPGKFSFWANWTEVGLANAGTATEQLVGLGIPAVSLPGAGPQFKRSFALRQSRLLGGSVIPCSSKEILSDRVASLLNDELFRGHLGAIGLRRMGVSGGSRRLAKLVSDSLLGN